MLNIKVDQGAVWRKKQNKYISKNYNFWTNDKKVFMGVWKNTPHTNGQAWWWRGDDLGSFL